MLARLYIKNYAIIDELTVSFAPELNIITGETGAGKSIVMGALGLILGNRADLSVLRNKEQKCFVEGFFDISKRADLLNWLEQNDIDIAEELVLRREITNSSKSRAFINDTPATLQQLKEIAGQIVDLHQQFDTLTLAETTFQRNVLDALAGNKLLVEKYNTLFNQWQSIKKELQLLVNQKTAFQKEADYNQFLFDELYNLSLKENELENIEAEIKALSQSENIQQILTKISYHVTDAEEPIQSLLKQLSNQLGIFSQLNTSIATLTQRLTAANIELQDIAAEATMLSSQFNYDEQKVAILNERMASGYKLQKKHGVKSTVELLAIQSDLEQKLQAALNIDDEITAKENICAKLEKDLTSLAAQLSAARKKQAPELSEKVNSLLQQVGMPNAIMKIDIASTHLSLYGADEIQFLFDANKSNRFEPVYKVASGGELSRLMLCIKSLVAAYIDLPTMIFDEIDTGISGEAAKQVGIIMQAMAKQRQIICITHQPQIAGKANAHLFVYKTIEAETIRTNIRQLNNDERITAIAKMLAGEKPTVAALENAKELINN